MRRTHPRTHAECSPVPYQSLLVLRFRQVKISAQGAAGEDGLTHLRAIGPDPDMRLHQAENTLLRPKAPPPEPVSAICGKNSALATPISALVATSTCSASRMSGRRSISAEGNPAGTSGGTAAPSATTRALRPWIVPDQNADRILFLRDRRSRSGIWALAVSRIC